jgi:hypothetical protein
MGASFPEREAQLPLNYACSHIGRWVGELEWLS